MKRKKIAGYLLVIMALIMLSLVTPLVIKSISGYITQRIRGSDASSETETETDNGAINEPGGGPADEDAQLFLEGESEGSQGTGHKTAGSSDTGRASRGEKVLAQGVTIDDTPGYEEPFYDTPEEEEQANQAAYEDMQQKLSTATQAALTYRQNFNPVYDELRSGIMNAFISGREAIFYEDIANYCFGRYNTTKLILKVRFDAITEDTEEKMTVILEFFSAGDMADENRVPDLAYCSYNKRTEAFVFYSNASS